MVVRRENRPGFLRGRMSHVTGISRRIYLFDWLNTLVYSLVKSLVKAGNYGLFRGEEVTKV